MTGRLVGFLMKVSPPSHTLIHQRFTRSSMNCKTDLFINISPRRKHVALVPVFAPGLYFFSLPHTYYPQLLDADVRWNAAMIVSYGNVVSFLDSHKCPEIEIF